MVASRRRGKGGSKDWLVETTRARVRAQPLRSSWPGPLARLQRYLLRDVWRTSPESLPPLKRLLHRALRVSFLTVRGFLGDGCLPRAAALTYITALSIIPMLALAFSMLKGLGFYRTMIVKIQPWLDRTLGGELKTTEEGISGPELRLAIHKLLERVDDTDFAGIGFLGLVLVLWATMRMLGSVEVAFNQIWGVGRARSLVRRMTDYLAIVLAVPMFVVVAIGVQTQLQESTRSTTFLNFLAARFGQVSELGFQLVPFLGGWLVFTFVYVVMPNTRSSLLSAILGGCMASALWQLLLWAHIRFQLGIANHNEIYAGFAAIPVFLVWLHLSWVTVLLGAELAFAHEHEPSYRGLALYEELDAHEREVLALRAAAGLTEVFLDRGGALSAAHLAARLGVQPHDVESVLRALEGHGLVIAAEDEDEGGLGFALARDPGAVTLKDVSDALRKGARPPEHSGEGRRKDALETLLERLDEDIAGSAHNIDLRELVRREQRDREARTSGAEEPGVQLS